MRIMIRNEIMLLSIKNSNNNLNNNDNDIDNN